MVSLFFSLYIHNNFSACFLSALPRLFDNLCVCFEKAASNVAFDNFHALFCLVSSLHSGLFFPVFSVVPFFLVWIFSGGFTREFNHLCARFFFTGSRGDNIPTFFVWTWWQGWFFQAFLSIKYLSNLFERKIFLRNIVIGLFSSRILL